jgi:diguanylate cyclase (GGDEF)-like protein
MEINMCRCPSLPSFILLAMLLSGIIVSLQPLCAVASNIAGDGGSAAQIQLTPEEQAFLTAHPVIRVGNEDDWPPFDFSSHGRPTGYAIMYLDLLGRRLGLSFEYVNGYTWFELLGLFRNHEIDLLPCLWKSESRMSFMSFTEPYLELPYVIVAPKNDRSTLTVEDLKGKTVATAKGYKQEEVLRTLYPEIALYQVQNTQEGLEAVIYGEADAYIGYMGTVAYLMATRFMGSLHIAGECKAPGLGPQGLHMAVRPELHPLADILQKAMDTVTDKEKVELAEKWIPADQSRMPELTTAEKIFLRKHPVLRVDNLENWPPFNFSVKGQPKGFCVDYMNLLAEKLEIEVEYVIGPEWDDFMHMLQAGGIDALCDVVKTPDRQKTISFTDPYFTIFSGIVVQKGNERFAKLDDLDGQKVAVPKAFYYQEILERHYPAIQVTAQKDTLSCLKAVSSGRAAAALSEKPVFDHLISEHFLTDLKSVPIMDSPHFEHTPVSIGVREDRDILRGILQKAMNKVSREERARLGRRWLKQVDPGLGRPRIMLSPSERQWLEEKGALRICVHPSWPPFEEIDETGVYRGIAADIVSLLAERIGTPIRVVPTTSWQESLTAMRDGRCDLLSSVSNRGPKKEGFTVSKPYIESVNVMVVRDGQPYIPDLHVLEDKKVGIVKGNPVGDYLVERFPRVRLRPAPDLENALEKVARGKTDVAIGSLHRVSHAIHELGLYDLKIAGQTPYRKHLCLGMKTESVILGAVMDKALESLSDREVSQITRKWLSIRYDKGLNTLLLLQILVGVTLLIGLFFVWNRKLARLNRQLGDAHRTLALKSRELEKLSITDTMTGILNRMKIEDLLLNEINRVRRSGRPFSVIMLDVDHFKQINDSHGHQAGDRVLREISRLLKESIRQADSLGRWGGEEFLILCQDTSGKGAAVLAEHLKRTVSGKKLAKIGWLTCSFGVAEYRSGETENQLLSRVDRAMYRAKELGRNRVELAE